MIEIQSITVAYGTKTVLDKVSISLPDGGCIALRGPSGAGKTTLLSVLAGLRKPDGGTVHGLENRRISMVFQEDRLLPWYTARQNVALVSDNARADALLSALGLSGAADLCPGALSGGMARRVALARALAFSDDVLLLDEPMNGLDPALREQTANVIRQSAKLIVAVTHEAHDAELLGAERAVFL